MHYLPYKVLIKKIKSKLKEIGADEFSANSVAVGLSETSLRGVDSHGIRLLPHYVNALKKGRINGSPVFKIIDTYPAFVGLDANNSFGHAAGFKSIEIGMDLAEKYGIGGVSVMNSSHPGAMASFAIKAAKKGYCCFSFTHADSLVQSYDSKQAFFGTNPICFAAPRANEEPFCVDMAPTFIPWNKVLEYKELEIDLEKPVAIDKNGNPTCKPEEAKSLMPIGNYKGYALAAMVEVLCSTLSGMKFGPHIPSMYGSSIKEPRKLGQFYIIFKSDVNTSLSVFEKNLQRMSIEIREQQSVSNNTVKVPNDPQISFQEERTEKGIPVSGQVFKILNN